jgi:hypothetical protein
VPEDIKRETESLPAENVLRTRPPSPRHYRRRLANLANVRVGLADVVRDLEEGMRDPATCRVLVYAYSSLANVIDAAREQIEFEERLSRLEATLKAQGRAFTAP